MPQDSTQSWLDYRLIDSGNQERLERFGDKYIVRPEPHALWEPENPNHVGWIKPDASFREGWNFIDTSMEDGFIISWDSLRIKIRPTTFRHLGLFPEQETQWKQLEEWVKGLPKGARVLNLFAYTGVMSLAAARAGAEVTHVDASKSSVSWANENAKLNNLNSIRWIVEDVRKFVEREVRRGVKYDVIVFDPPVFGRGTKGEIWRLEDEFLPLVKNLQKISNPHVRLLANIYATTTYPTTFQRVIEQIFNADGKSVLRSVGLRQEIGEKTLQTGYSIELVI